MQNLRKKAVILNIPNRSKLKTKADLENAIESTILKYKEVIYSK